MQGQIPKKTFATVLHPVRRPLTPTLAGSTDTLILCLSCGEPATQAEGLLLDLLSEEDFESLKTGAAYTRKRELRFPPEETAILHQSAGREAEQRRKSDATQSMIVTAADYKAYGISFLTEFPTARINWEGHPHKITLVDVMPQIDEAFTNALLVIVLTPDVKARVRYEVEQEVAALYKDERESEEERSSKLTARVGLYLIREMAVKLK